MKPSAIIILIATISLAAVAQELSPPKEIKDLSWMVGSWSGSGNIEFGGNKTEISTTMTVSVDGQFLKAVSEDKSGGFTLSKTTMTSWDATKMEFISYSFTNIAPTARIARGKIESGKLVMISDPWEAEGMKSTIRETIRKISDTKLALVMEFKSGEKWTKGMDFVLTKK